MDDGIVARGGMCAGIAIVALAKPIPKWIVVAGGHIAIGDNGPARPMGVAVLEAIGERQSKDLFVALRLVDIKAKHLGARRRSQKLSVVLPHLTTAAG